MNYYTGLFDLAEWPQAGRVLCETRQVFLKLKDDLIIGGGREGGGRGSRVREMNTILCVVHGKLFDRRSTKCWQIYGAN